jgi:hypothetical protein
MKYLTLIALLIVCMSPATYADGAYTELPISGDDLRSALDLNIHKYKIDFGAEGHATVQADGFSGPNTIAIDSIGRTATVLVYIEKSQKSTGISTLHFWISGEAKTIGCYIAFEEKNAVVTTTAFKDGEFSIIAKPSQKADEVGYSIKVTNAK